MIPKRFQSIFIVAREHKHWKYHPKQTPSASSGLEFNLFDRIKWREHKAHCELCIADLGMNKLTKLFYTPTVSNGDERAWPATAENKVDEFANVQRDCNTVISQ